MGGLGSSFATQATVLATFVPYSGRLLSECGLIVSPKCFENGDAVYMYPWLRF